MAELADALDLGSNAQRACRFKSCSRHHSPNPLEENLVTPLSWECAVRAEIATYRPILPEIMPERLCFSLLRLSLALPSGGELQHGVSDAALRNNRISMHHTPGLPPADRHDYGLADPLIAQVSGRRPSKVMEN